MTQTSYEQLSVTIVTFITKKYIGLHTGLLVSHNTDSSFRLLKSLLLLDKKIGSILYSTEPWRLDALLAPCDTTLAVHA